MQVTEEHRNYAKQLAYGLLYGKGPHALAVDLGCTVKTAAERHDSFMKSIPDVVRLCIKRADVGFRVCSQIRKLVG